MILYRAAADNFKAHIVSLRIALGILSIACIALVAIVATHTKSIRLSLPPVLQYGLEIEGGTIEPFEVYAFAGYIHQQLQTWRNDGAKDFRANLDHLRYFLSSSALEYYRQRLGTLDDSGELSGRARYILPAESYKPALVKVHTKDRWTVTLRYFLYERLEGLDLKDGVLLEVQLPIFYRNQDPEFNPWGLWLEEPVAPARRIAEEGTWSGKS